MADERVRGASLLGDEPKRLEFTDGSRLVLDGSGARDRIEWRRLGRGWTNVSVSEAVSLAGDESPITSRFARAPRRSGCAPSRTGTAMRRSGLRTSCPRRASSAS